MKPTFNYISVGLLLFLSKKALSNIFVEEALTECSLRVGDKADNNENIHRRMVRMNMPLGCEDSDVIMMDIPHDESKRFFSKTSTTTKIEKGLKKDESLSSPQYSSWVGEDESDGSMLMFVQDEVGHVSGSMLDLKNDHVVHLRTHEDGSYNAVITPSSDFPPEKDSPEETPPDVSQRKLVVLSEQDPLSTEETESNQQNHMSLSYKALDEKSSNKNSSRSLLDDSGGNLDVMVVWTKSAECANSGLSTGCTLTESTRTNMEALMNLAILETNTAYAASGVNTELHLTNAYRHPTYAEDSSGGNDAFSNGLSAVRNGQISDVHSNRETYGADIVALIINDGTYCGLGYIGPRIDLMYSVTHYGCATGYFSFGHEIGHNLGLNHDRGTSNTCGGSGYNYGYRDPQANFRTVLAYSCNSGQCDNNVGGGCTRIPRYSNPNFTYNGLSLGTASIDNARAINDARVEVAAYYPHKSSNTASPTTSPTTSPTATPVATLTAAPTNSPTATPVATLTAAPTAAPTATPNVTPAATPTDSPAATPTPPTSTSCTDSSLRIKVKKDNKFIMRDCIWVSNRSTNSRCALNGVSSTCSETCNSCSSCIDSPLRLKIFWKGKFIRRNCEWVGNKQTSKRCAVPGVADACRATCGKC